MEFKINKIYNGDCLELMPKYIPDKSVDIVLSDIPYGIDYDNWDILHKNTNSALGGVSPAVKKSSFKRRGKPINGWNESDKKISSEYYNWCLTWIKELFRITKEGSPILLFSARRFQHRVALALENNGFLIRDILIWEKNRCNPKAQRINNILNNRGIFDNKYNNYRIGNLAPIYEPIIWAMKPYSKTLTDCIVENDIGGFYCDNGKIPNNIIKCDINYKNIHPTEKPLELIERLINIFSISDKHIILDMFAGSGTTGIACLNTKRNYILIEKEKQYFDMIKKRIEDYNKNVQTKLFF